MFLGTHEPRLDEKGRLILPAKFREELSPGLVITKGQERCLYVFPSAEFATITETIFAWPGTGKLLIDSIYRGDRPVIVVYLMLTAFIFVAINFIVDIVYTLIDPRITVK